jgi:uncharacterized membrane protein
MSVVAQIHELGKLFLAFRGIFFLLIQASHAVNKSFVNHAVSSLPIPRSAADIASVVGICFGRGVAVAGLILLGGA